MSVDNPDSPEKNLYGDEFEDSLDQDDSIAME